MLSHSFEAENSSLTVVRYFAGELEVQTNSNLVGDDLVGQGCDYIKLICG